MLPDRRRGRRFQLWAYVFDHRQLLLRSNKRERHAQRCEVLFTQVSRLDLPTMIGDLEVHLASEEAQPAGVAQLGALELGDRVVDVIRGRNSCGYVVAGTTADMEDDGEYCSESLLLDN